MNCTPFFQETDTPRSPALTWLPLAHFALDLALGLFAVSNKLGHSSLFECCAVRLLRFANRLLGQTPPDSYLEFHPDLPMEI